MFTKKVVVSALLAVGMVGAVATPLASVAQVDIQLNWGPPTPRYEVIPVPRNGYIGSEGHWQWRGNRHVWIAGNWQAERPGYAWQPQWVERKGGRGWDYRASRWGRDGDGVPDHERVNERARSEPVERGRVAAEVSHVAIGVTQNVECRDRLA